MVGAKQEPEGQANIRVQQRIIVSILCPFLKIALLRHAAKKEKSPGNQGFRGRVLTGRLHVWET